MADESVGSAYLNVAARMDPSSASTLAREAESIGGSMGAATTKGFGAGTVAVGNIVSNLAQDAARAIGDFIGDSIQTGQAFDAAMSQVAATMGVTVDEIGDLREFAKQMGETTVFSATQSAEALNYMALAGYDAQTSMQMLPNVLNLAASGNIDLARASDMVTDAQSALGLSLEETGVMVDQMAKTASTTNTSVEQLGDAFLTVGGTAKVMQGGTQELSQVLGLLADNGIKGAEGGTALRNILLSLSAPTDQAAELMEGLGLKVFDAQGNMRDMQSIIGDLNGALSNMTDEEKTQAIATIFNKRDLKSVNALLGTSAERWQEVSDAIGNSAGAAEKMANTQLDNLQGDVTLFQSALEGLQIQLFEGIEPGLRAIVQFGSDLAANATNALKAAGTAFDDFRNTYIQPFIDRIAQAMEENAITEKLAYWTELLANLRDNVLAGIGAFLESTLLPIVNTLVGFIADHVIPMLADMEEFLTENVFPVLGEFGAWVGEYVAPILEQWVGIFVNEVIPTVAEFVGGIIDNVVPALQAMWSFFEQNILPILQAFADFIATNVLPVLCDIGDFISGTVIPAVSSLGDWINYNLVPAFSGLLDILSGVFDFLGGIVDAASNAISWVAAAGSSASAYYDYGGYAFYPMYATGGITNGPSIVGERGREFVWPSYDPYLSRYADALAAKMGGAGASVTITGNEFNVRSDADIDAIGDALVEKWARMQRGGSWRS